MAKPLLGTAEPAGRWLPLSGAECAQRTVFCGWPCAFLLICIALVFGLVLGHEFIPSGDILTVLVDPLGFSSGGGNLNALRAVRRGIGMTPVTDGWLAAIALLSRITTGTTFAAQSEATWLFAGNLCLHALATLGVWSLLSRVIRSWAAALLGSLLFALHPLQVQSVASAESFGMLLGAAFGVWSLVQYVDFRRAATACSRKAHYGAASTLFVLALLSAPLSGVVALAALAIDRLCLKTSVGRTLLSAGSWVLVGGCLIGWSGLNARHAFPVYSAPIFVRILLTCDAVTFFAWKLLLPSPLLADYGRSPLWLFETGWIWLTAAIPIVVVATMAISRVSRVWWLAVFIFASCIGTACLFKSLGNEFSSAVSDSNAYLALIGPALGLAWFLDGGLSTSLAAHVLTGLLLLTLGALSARQMSTTRDFQTLAEHTLQHHRDSAAMHVMLAAGFEMNGNHLDAIRHLEWSRDLQPRNAHLHYLLGLELLQWGDADAARRSLKTAAQLAPGAAPIYVAKGRCYFALSAFTNAEQEFLAALAIDKKLPEARLFLGETLIQQGRRAEAVDKLQQLTQDSPEFAPGWRAYSDALFAAGQPLDALRAARRALQADPKNPANYICLAHLLLVQEQIDEGCWEARRAIQIGSAPAELYNRLGVDLMQVGRLPEAADALRAAIRQRQDVPEPRFNLGEVLRRLGQESEAFSAYEEALRLDPRFSPAEVALLGCMERLGRIEDAVRHGLEFLHQQPRNIAVLESMGLLLMRQSQWDKAAKLFEQALAVAPQSPIARHNLTLAQGHLGEPEDRRQEN